MHLHRFQSLTKTVLSKTKTVKSFFFMMLVESSLHVFICRFTRCTEPPAPVSRRHSRSLLPASWPTKQCKPPPLTPPPLLPGGPSKSRSDWSRELRLRPCYFDPALHIPPNCLYSQSSALTGCSRPHPLSLTQCTPVSD